MKNENLKDKNIKNGKLAVVFPGVGYHADKPLLYYSRKLAAQYGYEIICADYGILPSGIKGDAGKMYAAFEQALSHVEEQLASVDFVSCSRVLFLSKSIGTAVAAAYDGKHKTGAGHVSYTPVEASFQFMTQPGIAFTGTQDSWVDHETIKEDCEKGGFPLYVIEDANHSLETGDVKKDLENLQEIMAVTAGYIS